MVWNRNCFWLPYVFCDFWYSVPCALTIEMICEPRPIVRICSHFPGHSYWLRGGHLKQVSQIHSDVLIQSFQWYESSLWNYWASQIGSGTMLRSLVCNWGHKEKQRLAKMSNMKRTLPPGGPAQSVVESLIDWRPSKAVEWRPKKQIWERIYTPSYIYVMSTMK